MTCFLSSKGLDINQAFIVRTPQKSDSDELLLFHFFDTVLSFSSSRVANALTSSSVVMSRYTMVVFNCSCPRRNEICTMFIPSSSQWLAFACLKWGAPHLRHSKAVHLLQAGVNLIYIRDFLGHSESKTTEVYARADTELKRKALENAYPDLVDSNLPDWVDNNDLMGWLTDL